MVWRAISVNKEDYYKPVHPRGEIGKRGRVDIKLFLPATDIPEYVYGHYDKDRNVFAINFRYINNEKEKLLFSKENFELIVGEFSGKPLKIEIKNVKKNDIDRIELTNIIRKNLNELVKSYIEKSKRLRERTSLEIAQKFLSEQAEAIALSL